MIDYDDFTGFTFEGEYLNGEKNGKGKEYNSYGDVLFEGEYYKGKKWTGKGYWRYDDNGFEIKEGKGLVKEVEKYKSFPIFIGEYINGERNGKGKEYYDYKLKFEGEYLNGERWNGEGIEYDHLVAYEIEYLNGEKNILSEFFYFLPK